MYVHTLLLPFISYSQIIVTTYRKETIMTKTLRDYVKLLIRIYWRDKRRQVKYLQNKKRGLNAI